MCRHEYHCVSSVLFKQFRGTSISVHSHNLLCRGWIQRQFLSSLFYITVTRLTEAASLLPSWPGTVSGMNGAVDAICCMWHVPSAREKEERVEKEENGKRGRWRRCGRPTRKQHAGFAGKSKNLSKVDGDTSEQQVAIKVTNIVQILLFYRSVNFSGTGLNCHSVHSYTWVFTKRGPCLILRAWPAQRRGLTGSSTWRTLNQLSRPQRSKVCQSYLFLII